MIRGPRFQIWGRAWWEWLFLVALAATAIGGFIERITDTAPWRPREGDPCGPDHVWTYIRQPDGDLELSCEKDE
jgi:hypothetical protein